MKNIFKILPLFFSLLIFISCEPEDKIINNSVSNYRFLFAYDNPNTISLTTLPDKDILYSDIYKDINGAALSNGVSRMVEFYNYIFVFIPESYKIDVLDKTTFKIFKTMDFSAAKRKPISICFPNVTDAYIIFDKDSNVALYDIVNFAPARLITAGRYPTSIASSGNQIYVTNQLDNTVSVIDSRTHKVEQTINVPEAPTFVDMTPDGLKAVIISLGGGKLDSTKTKTAAIASFIDISTRLIVKSKEIGTGSILPKNQIPQGFSITNKNIGVIATKEYLFRLETKFGDVVSLANRGNFTSVGYSFKTDELMMIKKDTKGIYLIIGDPLTTSQRSSYTLSNNISSILPL